MRQVLSGTVAARGMALGRARLAQPSRYAVDTRPLADDEVETEWHMLERALETARQELRELREKLTGTLAREVNEFIDAHSLLLDDAELLSGLEDMVRVGRYRPGAALKKQRERLSAAFAAMDDPYLRSRKEDVEQVINRVIAALQRQTSPEERKLAARVGEILVADSIAPTDMAQLAGSGLLGVVANAGSAYSHSAILARSLGLPMLVGARDALSSIHDDDLIMLDAERGEAVVHPAAQDLTRYRSWQRGLAAEGRRLATLANQPTRTHDGVGIRLLANAESPADIAMARARGSDGIGLHRTEFLFLKHKRPPAEEEQFTAYRDLVLGMGGAPVTIRTLDLGADKADAAGLAMRGEDNPALGLRGVRLSLHYPAVFSTQIRAILRAGCYGPVRVLVPMVSQPDELLAVRALFNLAREELRQENVDLPERMPLGAMIEVPAAAINVRALLEHADFLAIGTNDLAQYVLAADRNNDALGDIYNPLQPALLRLVAHVISCARRAGKPVSLCGEIAGDVGFTALLLALGLEEFSMHPAQILQVRDRMATLDHACLRRHAGQLLRAPTHEAVAQLLGEITADASSSALPADEAG